MDKGRSAGPLGFALLFCFLAGGADAGSQIIGGFRMETGLSARDVIQSYVNNFVLK